MIAHLEDFQRQTIENSFWWDAPTISSYEHLNVHGIPLKIYSDNQVLLSSIKDFFVEDALHSKASHKSIRIEWHGPDKVLNRDILAKWGEDSNPDCRFYKKLDREYIIQRDFVAYEKEAGHWVLFCKQELDDGLFNFFRFLLPSLLIKNNLFVMHSSCVINSDRKAFLFLGESGAGKTTISQLCKDNGGQVLGDDMNLLSHVDGQFYVSSAQIGQQIFEPKLFGERFVLQGIYWLHQSHENKMVLNQASILTKLMRSYSGLFWKRINKLDLEKIFTMNKLLSNSIKFYDLKFNLTGDIWSELNGKI